MADRLTEVDDLIHRADLDGLVRMVDSLCADDAWQSLLELRNRSRAAVVTGRQLWPVATLAEYRLALWAPAEWAAQVLDEDSGRFTIGPLTEVVAQRHEFADLRAALPQGPRLGFIAHECAFRGQLVATGLANPLEIPFELQPWEPQYCLAEYSDDGVSAPAPPLPTASEFVTMPRGSAEVIEDPEVVLAVRQLIEPWTTSSNGRVDIVAVEGEVASAVAALGVDDGRLAPIAPSNAAAWLAWAGVERRRPRPTARCRDRTVRCVVDGRRVGRPCRRLARRRARRRRGARIAGLVLVGRRRATARLGTATRRRRSG